MPAASVGAQPPAYLIQWGSRGDGEGRFEHPGAVATDAAGDVYVAEHGDHRVQKFGSALTPTRPTTWGRLKSLYP